ncbi:MAG: hypothetical protein BWY89_01713 [Bacteroidetes bacterium ADurb.BinA012]|nr:MAG: hypothetical protein BWY89_01713 [Bacteroidetes bacterium ADurb.BinA012]
MPGFVPYFSRGFMPAFLNCFTRGFLTGFVPGFAPGFVPALFTGFTRGFVPGFVPDLVPGKMKKGCIELAHRHSHNIVIRPFYCCYAPEAYPFLDAIRTGLVEGAVVAYIVFNLIITQFPEGDSGSD